ncbi:MAG: hypothetical protein EOP14_00210 [Pseudomonas sp.]|nr:MAG: hypothetical protein EOP14_00210 [Pseudomonas sp.]
MATTPVRQQTISRAELAEFIRSPSTIRKFENLQSNVEEALPGNVDDIRAIAQAASDLSLLLQNRSYIVFNAEGDLDNSRSLAATGGLEVVDGPAPNTVTIRTKDLLSSIAALSSAGFIVRNGTSALTRVLLAASPKITIANGSGVTGDPAFNIEESALDLANMGGTLGIAHGGTGATTLAAAQAALGFDTVASTGDFKQRAAATFPAGWVRANAGTIGSSGSGATRANSDTQALFTLWWTDFTDAQVPIQTSGGAASTRGASASADFTANKRMTVPVVADVSPLIGAYKL